MIDLVEYACASCGARNRLPAARVVDDPTCGRCKAKLFPRASKKVTDASFAADVDRAPLPVLVDFWAPWCGPCRTMEPTLESLAAKRAGEVIIAKVNVDDNPALARRFTIRSIPAMKLFRNGELAGELNGAVPASALDQFLTQHGV
jgi:thioredoxin 2